MRPRESAKPATSFQITKVGVCWVTDRENPDIGIGIKSPTNVATPSFVRRRRAARYSAMVVNCSGLNGSISQTASATRNFALSDRRNKVRSKLIRTGVILFV